MVAVGAIAHDYGTPGVHEHTFPLKHVDDALALRAHVLDCFERAAVDPSLVADGVLDVVICGGGPTGVEMAGGLHELYDKVLAKDFPQLPVRSARIVVVEMADRLLTPFTEESSRRARRTLERRDVEVILGVGVSAVEDGRVHLTDGSSIGAGTIVWATGVTAEPLAAAVSYYKKHKDALFRFIDDPLVPIDNSPTEREFQNVAKLRLNMLFAGSTEGAHRACVLLGMGGSSLAPEVLRRASGAESFHVLDTTHPAAIRALESRIDPDDTLFIAASKSPL